MVTSILCSFYGCIIEVYRYLDNTLAMCTCTLGTNKLERLLCRVTIFIEIPLVMVNYICSDYGMRDTL